MHRAIMHCGVPSLSITVVPDSGTDDLVGLAGEFDLKIDGGLHNYVFTYTFA